MRVLILSFLIAAGIGGAPHAQRSPTPGDADRIRIAEAFRLADTLGERMCVRLDEAVRQEPGERTTSAVRAYLEAKRVFRGLVSPDDYKYFSFQLWQEGIARYTEYRIGELASTGFEPTPAFAALPDFASYAVASKAILDRVHTQLTKVVLGDAQRSAFYPVGAAEGILLDRINPEWRNQYSRAGFTLDGLLGAPTK